MSHLVLWRFSLFSSIPYKSVFVFSISQNLVRAYPKSKFFMHFFRFFQRKSADTFVSTVYRYLLLARTVFPAYSAMSPSISSMRKRRLYLATRSLRQGAPVLMNGAPTPTARSAMKSSSVSPLRCEMTMLYPADSAVRMA